MSLTTVEKAIKLTTQLGFYVFPWTLTRDGRKVPLTENGHLDAIQDDIEQIATWFSDSKARIGVHVGKSGLVVADIDVKEGKNGFESTDGWLDFPHTFDTDTGTGGKHFIYAAPEGIRLAPSGNFQGWRGLDVRGGSSWIAWWSDTIPEDRSVFAPAPEWLCEPAKELPGAAFEGGLDDWLSQFEDAEAEPNERVLRVIERIPDDFGRFELLDRQFELVRLAAEGCPGVLHGLQVLREAWLRDEWDTDDGRYTFDVGLDGAIRKAGALEDRIADLPDYRELVTGEFPVALSNLLLAKKSGVKVHWFNTGRSAIRHGFNDDEVVSLLWSGPSTRELSREWGIEFVYERVAEMRVEHEASEKANNDAVSGNYDSPLVTEPGDKPKANLLSDAERSILAANPNFVHRYLAYAEDRFSYINTPYHRANAWTILSLAYGPTGFFPAKGKALGLNLFQNVTGESGSGKSDSIILRDEILKMFFGDDGGYDFGSEASGEVMHEDLLNREGAPAFFNSDEAAAFYASLNNPTSWQAKLQDRITDWYGGWAGPVKKRGMNGKGGPCYLVTQFFATPTRLFDSLTTEQFDSGFLARFLWSYGEPAMDEDDGIDSIQDDAPRSKDADPRTVDLVQELQELASAIGTRRPYRASAAELKRIAQANRAMRTILHESTNWNVTAQAYRRMRDSLLKCCSLMAASRGSTHIEMVDVLGALEQMEVWLDGLIYASSQVSASVFERQARDIAQAVKRMGRPWVTEARLSNQFAQYNEVEWKQRIEWTIRHGLVILDETRSSRRYGWRGKEVEEE